MYCFYFSVGSNAFHVIFFVTEFADYYLASSPITAILSTILLVNKSGLSKLIFVVELYNGTTFQPESRKFVWYVS